MGRQHSACSQYAWNLKCLWSNGGQNATRIDCACRDLTLGRGRIPDCLGRCSDSKTLRGRRFDALLCILDETKRRHATVFAQNHVVQNDMIWPPQQVDLDPD